MTLAGFSGIVVVFRLRWSPVELRFLWFLVGDSLLVTFFALLPIPMALANWSDDIVWTICSSLLGSWFIIGNLLALHGERRDRAAQRQIIVPWITPILFGVYVVAIAMGVALWLSAWDLGVPRGQAMYVFGLIVLLAFAALEFLFFIGLTSRQETDQ